MVSMESNEHTKIRWEKPTLAAFISFMGKLSEFQHSHGQTVRSIYVHIAPRVRVKLNTYLGQINRKYATDQECFMATGEEILTAVKRWFLPKDTVMFLSTLEEACKPYAVDKVHLDFSITRQSLAQLQRKFVEIFKFLKEACEDVGFENVVPKANFKNGGFLNLWFKLTPGKQRSTFKNLLSKDRFKSCDEFFREYEKTVTETDELRSCIQIYEHRTSVNILGVEEDQKSTSLNAIEESSDGVESGDGLSSTEEGNLCATTPGNQYQKRSLRPETEMKQRDPDQQVKKYICLKHERGECEHGTKCKFSHHPNDIRDWRIKTQKRLTDILTREGVLQKTSKEQAPGSEGEVKRNFKILKKEDIDQDVAELNLVQGSQSLEVISELFKLSESSDAWHVLAHRNGWVSCKGQQVEIKTVLFDTGADSDNYISWREVQRLKLQDKVIRVRKGVRVANGSLITISGQINLEVTFMTEEGKYITADLMFLILEGLSKALVIGFPDICKHFSEVLMEMVKRGAEKLKGDPTEIIEINVLEENVPKSDCEFGEVIQYPWSKEPDEVAEEEEDLVEPCSFSRAINFLEKPYQEALLEYSENLATELQRKSQKQRQF
jgi:hypothetical protein